MNAGQFSRYELMEQLGQGGMATVYRAYDPLFEREVALKILRRELLNDTQVRERFERETKIIARLENEAIVPVYDVGRDNDQLFFVMRYMSGGTLSERIQKGAMPIAEVTRLMLRIGSALDYAHSRGIIHRDLKPGNILFDESGNAFISDFGIAKFAHASTDLTVSGIIGTPTYMSPEQAQGDEVDARSDIYSLGVILFEMLSGRTPFEATTPLGMAYKHATEPVPHIRAINPDMPFGVDIILSKTLAKHPEERYDTGAEFANAFVKAISEPMRSDPNLATLLPGSTGLSIPQTNRRIMMFSGFILLALAAFAVWGYSQSAASPSLTPAPAIVTAAPAALAPATPTAEPAAMVTPTEAIPIIPLNPGGANKIALTANKDIYLMDMDGSHARQLTNTDIPKFDLQWLPGGRELLYAERNCVYRIDVEADQTKLEKLACFNGPDFSGFRVSPDGKQVAISIENRLLVLPYDLEALSTAPSTFELQSLENVCLDYADVAVKRALWSDDGRSLTIMYQSVVGNRIGDTIRVLEVELERCERVDPLIIDEFPAKRFIPDGYERYPILPSYQWDGGQRFLFNTFKRNVAYGELYLYDSSTAAASKVNPVDGVCCYSGAAISPDGTYMLFVFQDVRSGENSESQLYYIPMDQLGTEGTFTPLKLPIRFFPDLRENILIALRPSAP